MVSIDPAQAKKVLGGIGTDLEREWMEAGTSWAPAEGAMAATDASPRR